MIQATSWHLVRPTESEICRELEVDGNSILKSTQLLPS
jgi:hypothetical protein